MKFRSDFVTNSSSSSYSVTVGLVLKDGTNINYEFAAPQDDAGDCGNVDLNMRSIGRMNTAKTIEQLISMLQKAVEYEKPYFDEEDEDDEYDFTENKDDLYETGSDGEDEYKIPIYYIGLDSRKSFEEKVKSLGIQPSDIAKVYMQGSYYGDGEFVKDEQQDLYKKCYGEPCYGSLSITERKELDFDTGKVSHYIDSKLIPDD